MSHEVRLAASAPWAWTREWGGGDDRLAEPNQQVDTTAYFADIVEGEVFLAVAAIAFLGATVADYARMSHCVPFGRSLPPLETAEPRR